MSSYLYLMGWNEILARVFEGFEFQPNVSPDWLVNPATQRKLKLDLLYPEIGIAVRFAGLQAKGRGRKSDWEELEEASRNEVRKELCRLHGVDLVLIVPYDPYPERTLRELTMVLGSASRRIAKQGRFRGKAKVMERLSAARKRLDEVRRHVHKPEDLTPFAEAWRDREARERAEAKSVLRKGGNGARRAPRFKVGQGVRHEHFGEGVVTRVEAKEDDVYITVDFLTAGERTFIGSLLAGKMVAVRKRAPTQTG